MALIGAQHKMNMYFEVHFTPEGVYLPFPSDTETRAVYYDTDTEREEVANAILAAMEKRGFTFESEEVEY